MLMHDCACQFQQLEDVMVAPWYVACISLSITSVIHNGIRVCACRRTVAHALSH